MRSILNVSRPFLSFCLKIPLFSLTLCFPIKRFELALYTLLVKGALCKAEQHGQKGSCIEMEMGSKFDYKLKGKNLIDGRPSNKLESPIGRLCLKDDVNCQTTAHNIVVELANCIDFQSDSSDSQKQMQQAAYVSSQTSSEQIYASAMDRSSSFGKSFSASCPSLGFGDWIIFLCSLIQYKKL